MSHYSYMRSKEISDEPFDALVMAAMRNADTFNCEALQLAFPGIWGELKERYNSPGGLLPEELDANSNCLKVNQQPTTNNKEQ